jgi:hypothetical protein
MCKNWIMVAEIVEMVHLRGPQQASAGLALPLLTYVVLNTWV